MTRFFRPLAALHIVPYLASLILLSVPGLLQSVSSRPAATIIAATAGDNAGGPWRPVDVNAYVPAGNHEWLKLVFTVPTAAIGETAPPLGLFLSGTFSATAYWNGVDIGSKGRPASARADEEPGRIDRVIHLPRETVVPGNNTLLLEVSSHYRQASLTTVIHGGEQLPGLRLAPYSAEIRRPLGYYAAPLLMIVVLGVAMLVLWVRPKPERGPWFLPRLLVIALAVAAVAEIFRAFIAYPYPYHIIRLCVLSGAIVVFANSLVFYVAVRVGLPFRPWIFSTSTLMWLGAVYWPGPPEDVATLAVVAAVGLSLGLTVTALINKRGRMLPLLGAVVCLIVLLLSNSTLFFDRNLYAAVVPLVALLLWPIQSGNEARQPVTQSVGRLVVNAAGAKKLIALDKIVAISGAGNYAEIVLADGGSLLDDRGLKNLAKDLPGNFQRVHRSHIVNLNYVAALRSLGAGKYAVETDSKTRYAVSRHKVRELRQRLEIPQPVMSSTKP